MEKIKIVEIVIDRAEGPRAYCGKKTVETIDEANKLLRQHARTAPKTGQGYDKCDFVITFADGETYDGRFDLQSDGLPYLEDHIHDFLMCYSGLRKPRRWTEAEYSVVINRTPGLKEVCVRMLNDYDYGYKIGTL